MTNWSKEIGPNMVRIGHKGKSFKTSSPCELSPAHLNCPHPLPSVSSHTDATPGLGGCFGNYFRQLWQPRTQVEQGLQLDHLLNNFLGSKRSAPEVVISQYRNCTAIYSPVQGLKTFINATLTPHEPTQLDESLVHQQRTGLLKVYDDRGGDLAKLRKKLMKKKSDRGAKEHNGKKARTAWR